MPVRTSDNSVNILILCLYIWWKLKEFYFIKIFSTSISCELVYSAKLIYEISLLFKTERSINVSTRSLASASACRLYIHISGPSCFVAARSLRYCNMKLNTVKSKTESQRNTCDVEWERKRMRNWGRKKCQWMQY